MPVGGNRLIKVRAAIFLPNGQPSAEWLWAIPINVSTVKLENIPFFATNLSLGDLVEIDENNNITRIIEHCCKTRSGQFEMGESTEESTRKWKVIIEYFHRFDVSMEGMGQGFFTMAVPRDMTFKRLKRIAVGCPERVEVFK